MIKKLWLLSLLIASCTLVHSQNTINGTVVGLSNEKITLVQTFGSKQIVIDSSNLDENGSFRFMLDPSLAGGQYQLFTASGMNVDLIYNSENIQFVAIPNEFDKQVQIIESIENMIYYDFINIKQRNLLKLDILSPVIQFYPKNDEYYQTTVDKMLDLRTELNERAKELINNNPNTIASHLIKIENPVFADINLSENLQIEFLKSHFFDHIDFNDTVLLQSSLLNSKVISYLSLYQNGDVDRETFENNLLMGVDSLLSKASVNQAMYEYMVGFLIKGFEAIGFEKGLEHIANHNQLDKFCVNTKRLLELQNKVEMINSLALGKTAPDFITTDINGSIINLGNIDSDKIVLFFWASWCPHCKELIPELNEIYKADSNKNIQVIGISIDTNIDDLKQAINDNDILWPNIADLKGWDGEIVTQYGIAATPSIFILDKEKTILAKPTNKAQLTKLLE